MQSADTSPNLGQQYQPSQIYHLQSQQQTRLRFNTIQDIRQMSIPLITHPQQLNIQRKVIQQQQQQLKQRLLQQQQQQQLLIPSNATATDQISSAIHNIDNLLNNTVAPNVTLQVKVYLKYLSYKTRRCVFSQNHPKFWYTTVLLNESLYKFSAPGVQSLPRDLPCNIRKKPFFTHFQKFIPHLQSNQYQFNDQHFLCFFFKFY